MNHKRVLSSGVAAIVGVMALGDFVSGGYYVQVGASGKSFASSAVQCAADPATGVVIAGGGSWSL